MKKKPKNDYKIYKKISNSSYCERQRQRHLRLISIKLRLQATAGLNVSIILYFRYQKLNEIDLPSMDYTRNLTLQICSRFVSVTHPHTNVTHKANVAASKKRRSLCRFSIFTAIVWKKAYNMP